MNVFDREDIFRVREGLVGKVEGCRDMVFHSTESQTSGTAFETAATRLSVGTRFTSHTRQGNRQAMVDRNQEALIIKQAGRHIVIVIGKDADRVKATSERLAEKVHGA